MVKIILSYSIAILLELQENGIIDYWDLWFPVAPASASLMQRTASKKYQKHGPIHISSILSFP
jgi:hypothetical protein